MKRKLKISQYILTLVGLLNITLFISCQPEDSFDNNGLTDYNVNAAFSIDPIEAATNRYLLKGSGENVLKHIWNIGDEEFIGTTEQEVYFPDAGTYTISHIAIGRGGATNSSTEELVVEQSDPEGGNILLGGKFETTEDHAQWSVLNISTSEAEWTFNQGSATITASGWNQQGIFQAVEVEANQDYSIDLKAWGEGSQDTWFEVFVSPVPPVQGADYSGDVRIGLNTWDGCGNTPFNGKLSIIGCTGSGNIINFPQAGTVYFIIKCGGGNVGQISITNVEMRKIN
ncbi:hypothetical protein [Abyssalbus ytuae]|uniref:PKD domain-containing protein n=1 Tax=Abyssalbus ytuae TaxID=2926907 RepID=A0A9E7CTR1_9FLAO|nr:hypothetical protein [Abyssalbus ytuae]UOB16632.1 hypothetical protein MQE35_12905 [Abyssalbus ytuae]